MKEEKITKENLNLYIKGATKSLLEIARDHTWNKISNEVIYVINKVKIDEPVGSSFYEDFQKKKNLLHDENRLSFSVLIEKLTAGFENIYLIEFFILKAKRQETIIEVLVLEKSELEIDFQRKIRNNAPMLHCKVRTPPYIGFDKKEKFDINWQLKTFTFYCKMFWARKKNKILKLITLKF